jgi:hypothetical protein
MRRPFHRDPGVVRENVVAHVAFDGLDNCGNIMGRKITMNLGLWSPATPHQYSDNRKKRKEQECFRPVHGSSTRRRRYRTTLVRHCAPAASDMQ